MGDTLQFLTNLIRKWLLKITKNVKFGKGTKISPFTNLYDCFLGDNVFIGPFCELQKKCYIGNNTRIQSHSFVCEGVKIQENVFVGHGVIFINDIFNKPLDKWELKKTLIRKNVRIGSNSTILPVEIGENSIIGAGSVVTKNIPPNEVWAGNPAHLIRKL